MILDRILALYDPDDQAVFAGVSDAAAAAIRAGRQRREPGKGNPTASAAGRCLAQLEQARFPALTHPAAVSPRSAWVREDGDLHAADLRRKVELAFPDAFGLDEELFYAPARITADQGRRLAERIASRPSKVWGTLIPGFSPPSVRIADEPAASGKPRYLARLVERHPRDPQRPRPLGFVLDMAAETVYIPAYIDRMVKHPDHGLMVAEFKSMSRYAFRRALMGEMDDAARMQLALIHAATKHPVLWLCKAKDTSHLLEIAFLPGLAKVRVEITKTNGQTAVYFVPKPGVVVTAEGTVVPDGLAEGDGWEIAKAWIPMDDALLAQAGARAVHVLLFDADPDPANLNQWDREYGPDFRCRTCDGTGTQALAKTTRQPLVKGPVPCKDCGAVGLLEETTLPAFPCGYCASIEFCFAAAQPRLEVTTKPVWYVRRDLWDASGIVIRTTLEGTGAPPLAAAEGA